MKKTLAFMLATAMLMALCSFAAAQEGDYMIFEGKKTAQGKDAMLDFYFTEHVGGAFDATAMTKGSKLVLEYDGPEKDGVYADVSVAVQYGYNVPELAYRIQQSVKQSVENMTHFKVAEVDVHVIDVVFDAPTPAEKEEEPHEEDEEVQDGQ